MIDFRYHIVSLAAVLIALSIGIVLGAGPLNDNIGSTLSGEVTKLRQEKEDLRAQANEQRRQIEGRDAYDEQTLSKVVGGQLSGQRVTLLTLPQAEADDTAALRETLEMSGATVADPIGVTADWAAVGDAAVQARSETGAAALRDLAVAEAVPDGAQRVDQALAVVLTGKSSDPDSPEVDGDQRQEAWTRLRDAGLVDGPDEAPVASDLVVVLGGPVPAEGEAGADAVDRAAEATAGAWVALTHLVQTRAKGTVLAAAEADAGTVDASPVTMARMPGSLAEEVSTVDVPSLPLGRAATVLALVEQLGGESGHYGLGASADAPLPEAP